MATANSDSSPGVRSHRLFNPTQLVAELARDSRVSNEI
jgi:hypothetical protein